VIAPGYSLKDEELMQYESIRNPMRLGPPSTNAAEKARIEDQERLRKL